MKYKNIGIGLESYENLKKAGNTDSIKSRLSNLKNIDFKNLTFDDIKNLKSVGRAKNLDAIIKEIEDSALQNNSEAMNTLFKKSKLDRDEAQYVLRKVGVLPSEGNENTSSQTAESASKTAEEASKVANDVKNVGDTASNAGKSTGKIAEDVSKSSEIANGAMEGLGNGGAGATIKGILSSAGKFLLVTAAITLAVKGIEVVFNKISNYVNAFDNSLEDVNKKQSEFTSATKQLDSLKNSYKDVNSQVEKLNGKEHRTFSEESELNKLKDQSNELKQQVAIQQKVADVKSKSAANASEKVLTMNRTLDTSPNKKDMIVTTGGHGDVVTTYRTYEKTDVITATKNEVKKLNDLKQQKENLLKDWDSAPEKSSNKKTKTKDDINKEIENLEKQITDNDKTVSKNIESLNKAKKGLEDSNGNMKSNLTDTQKSLYNSVNDVLSDYVNDPYAKMQESIDKLLDNDDYADMEQEIVNKIRNGAKVSESDLTSQFPDFVAACKEAGISVTDLKKHLDALGNSSGATKLEQSFEDFQNEAAEAMDDMDKLNTVMAKSVSGKGLSLTVDSSSGELKGELMDIKDIYSGVKGYDESKLLEKTANGVHLNVQALRELQAEKEKTQKKKYTERETSLQKQLNQAIQQRKNLNEGTDDYKAVTAKISSYKEQIESVRELASAYDGATSAYQKWLSAQSNGEEGDMYRTVSGTMKKRGKELASQGRYNTNEFRAIAQFFSNKDLSTASIDEVKKAYEKGSSNFKYFNGKKSGLDAFVQAMKKVSDKENLGWVKTLKNGKLQFDTGSDDEIAKKFNMSKEAVQALYRAMSEYDDSIVLGDTNVDKLNKNLDNTKKKVKELKKGESVKVQADVVDKDGNEISDKLNKTVVAKKTDKGKTKYTYTDHNGIKHNVKEGKNGQYVVTDDTVNLRNRPKIPESELYKAGYKEAD